MLLCMLVSQAGNPYSVAVHYVGDAKEDYPTHNIRKGDSIALVSMPGGSLQDCRPIPLEKFRNEALNIETAFTLRPATNENVFGAPRAEEAEPAQ